MQDKLKNAQKVRRSTFDVRRHGKRPNPSLKPIALTIAGSDCSGGAGLEADLKTFAANHVYGMAVATCVVAENPGRVVSIHPVPPKVVQQQIACCLDSMPPVAIKTGMLFSESIIRAVHHSISNFKFQISNFIMDPVMVATSGRRLLRQGAIRTLKALLDDQADLVTPNLDEAEILAERRIRTESQMETASKIIAGRFHCAVLLKGGHFRRSKWAADFFLNGNTGLWLRSPRVHGIQTHGTGCTYSAAITANLAQGRSLENSVRRAKKFVTAAIRHSSDFGPWMALNHNANI